MLHYEVGHSLLPLASQHAVTLEMYEVGADVNLTLFLGLTT